MTERIHEEPTEELVPGMILEEIPHMLLDDFPLPKDDASESQEKLLGEINGNVVKIAEYARNQNVPREAMRAADAATLGTVLLFARKK